MIKIENFVGPSPEQWAAVIRGMRNPLNSWEKSDSGICAGEDGAEDKGWCIKCPNYGSVQLPYMTTEIYECDNPGGIRLFRLGKKDMELAVRLCAGGPEHRKFLRQLPVTMDITAPLYWWKQMDKYQIGTVTDSCSTMHKLTQKPFTREDFSFDCFDYFMELGGHENFEETVIKVLNVLRDYSIQIYTDLESRKIAWEAIVELLPEGYNQKRTWTANYEVLRAICHQRDGHKLSEWAGFIDWIRGNIPYAKDLLDV